MIVLELIVTIVDTIPNQSKMSGQFPGDTLFMS